MTDKQLFIDILDLFKKQHNINKNQKLFDDLVTKKFNEIIDFVNDLEKRIIILEDKKIKIGRGQK